MANTKKDEYPALTVDQLWKACVEQRKKGNGKKKILLSGDDEGNSFHGLFYLFLDDTEEIKKIEEYGLICDTGVPIDDVVVLG